MARHGVLHVSSLTRDAGWWHTTPSSALLHRIDVLIYLCPIYVLCPLLEAGGFVAPSER